MLAILFFFFLSFGSPRRERLLRCREIHRRRKFLNYVIINNTSIIKSRRTNLWGNYILFLIIVYILFYSQFENTGIFLQIIDPLDLYRASIIRDFILTRRVHLLLALRLVFPTDSPLVTFPLRIIVRLLTIPLQLLINHTLPVQDHVSFLSCTFSSFLFPLLDSKATSFIPPTWDSFLSLFSLRILSRRSIRNLEVVYNLR